MTQWVEFETADDVALAAADSIMEHARFSIQQRAEFRLVLAGGTSPISCYRKLAQRELEWNRWKLFYGDERCLPQQDAQRNANIVASTGLPQRVGQHFPIPAELGAEKGAQQYASIIDSQMPFDTVLLGMGEDGHTASLFPGQDWMQTSTEPSVIPVHQAPKPPPDRISLSLSALQNCRQMLVLVSGESKREAVRRWQQGEDLPIAQVSNVEQAIVFVESSLVNPV